MFRKNDGHKQQRMFTTVDQLPETARKHLAKSWAHVFYHEYFCKLDETVFSVLYSKKYSRPNTPIFRSAVNSYEEEHGVNLIHRCSPPEEVSGLIING
jgi:hypothetical protein